MLRLLAIVSLCGLLSAPANAEEPADAPATDDSTAEQDEPDEQDEPEQDAPDTQDAPDAPAEDAPDAPEAPTDDDAHAPPIPPAPPAPTEPPAPAVDLARSTGALYADGYQRFSQGDFGSAALLFEEVLRREPRHPSARNYLVECYAATGRDDDAARARDGGVPEGEATAAPKATATVRPTPEPSPADEEARRLHLNPRRRGMGGAGLGLLGPTVGLGIWAEFRPVWLLSITGGVGGLGIRRESGSRSGIAAAFAEFNLMPVPFRLTPILGVGVSVLGGPATWQVDSYARALGSRGNARGLVYLVLGLRYDTARGLFLSAGVGLVPTGRAPGAFTPWPGVRFGLRF